MQLLAAVAQCSRWQLLGWNGGSWMTNAGRTAVGCGLQHCSLYCFHLRHCGLYFAPLALVTPCTHGKPHEDSWEACKAPIGLGACHAAALVCAQVQDVMLAIHTLWGAPVLIVVIVGLLYQQLGWATFVGLIVVAVYSPISSELVFCGV